MERILGKVVQPRLPLPAVNVGVMSGSGAATLLPRGKAKTSSTPVLSSIWSVGKLNPYLFKPLLVQFFVIHGSVPDWGRALDLSVALVMVVVIWVLSYISLLCPRCLCKLGESTWSLWPVCPDVSVLTDEKENSFFTGYYLDEVVQFVGHSTEPGIENGAWPSERCPLLVCARHGVTRHVYGMYPSTHACA